MKIRLTYFKETGKRYTDHELEVECKFAFEVWQHVQAMIASDVAMPGLIGKWEGYTHAEITEQGDSEGLTHLFMPPASRPVTPAKTRSILEDIPPPSKFD